MKPSPAREEEKLYKEHPVDKGQGNPAALSEVNEVEAGECPPGNPIDRLRALKGLVEVHIEQMMEIADHCVNHGLGISFGYK